MSTRTYTLPVEQTRWHVESGARTVFTWEYDEGRDRLLNLYEKGKTRQWNSRERIDWDVAVDPDDPLETPDAYVPIYGSDVWERMGAAEHAEVKRHLASWQFSQFLHGEQGALIGACKIVQPVPDIDSKFYAATQVMDEARHVAFGRLALRDVYPQLTERERDEREEFCVEACYLMRDRFLAEEVWSYLGLPVDECVRFVNESVAQPQFPRPVVHAYRPHPEGHRPARAPGAGSLRGHGRSRVQNC